MDISRYITFGIAVIGWSLAISQFFLSRKYQKQDKIIEKRFEVYADFMKKIDEMNKNMRTNPNSVFDKSTEMFSSIISGDEEAMDSALIKFNSDIISMTRNSIEPLSIITSEINKLKIICSNSMLPKIEEYKKLILDYTDEFQIVLNKLSSNPDLNVTVKELTNLGNQERNLRLTRLWNDIEKMMREEIGYYSK